MPTKRVVFVTGGVVSGLGKGLTTAAIGVLLQDRGWAVNFLKFDPYLNMDAGTLSPHQHGEVYVLDDGAETDLDLGHYERFTGLTLAASSNVTAGQIYQSVRERERSGGYGGATVQLIPHVTDEIKRRIDVAAEGNEILLVEIGGTAGDIESMLFLEAVRQYRQQPSVRSVLVHLALVPHLRCSGEQKTKPAQASVSKLNQMGLFPDVLVCRSERPVGPPEYEKLSLFCNVPRHRIFENPDVPSVYLLPSVLEDMAGVIQTGLGCWRDKTADHSGKLRRLADTAAAREIEVALVGKYHKGADSYRSVREALLHAGWAAGVRVKVREVDSDSPAEVASCAGSVIPGGFGVRGTPGMVEAARVARERKRPCLGICLGMQMMAIEYARNVLGRPKADSREFAPDCDAVIDLLPGKHHGATGGDLRRGSRRTMGESPEFDRSERFRHRYGLRHQAASALAVAGLRVAASDEEGVIAAVRLADHPWYTGVQFHPELTSRPEAPHPLFLDFVKAASA